MGTTVSGTDQSRTDHLRGFRPALFQLSYGPRCLSHNRTWDRRERAAGIGPAHPGWKPGVQPPALRPQVNQIWSGWPDSNRHRRVGNAQLCPLSYTHIDGRRDGIRTRVGLSPDRFAGGRLRLLGHSALAAEEGLEPPIYRLTAGRCASSATPQGPQRRGHPARVSPARLGRAWYRRRESDPRSPG